MDDKQLEQIKARADKATEYEKAYRVPLVNRELAYALAWIKKLCEDIPALLTEIERLQAENRKRKAAMKKMAGMVSDYGFCTHYPGYTCDKGFPEACAGCIQQWAMRGVKGGIG